MKMIFLVVILLLFIFESYAQVNSDCHCEKGDSINFQYFEHSRVNKSLKPVKIEKGKMIVDFLEKFNDSVVVFVNNQVVFTGFVQNQNNFLTTQSGFVVSNVCKNQYMKLRLLLVNESCCIEILFKPHYKRLTITRIDNMWLIGNSNYMLRVIE